MVKESVSTRAAGSQINPTKGNSGFLSLVDQGAVNSNQTLAMDSRQSANLLEQKNSMNPNLRNKAITNSMERI